MGKRVKIAMGLAFLLFSESKGWTQIPSTLGWYQIPNTMYSSVCPNDPSILGVNGGGCANVAAAWGGGIADTKRNRLVFWGGGHVDYSGNEVYALNLNTLSIQLIKNPTTNPNDSTCPEALYDGNPDSRHTYDGLAYYASADVMLAYSGSLATCGSFSNGLWTLDMTSLAWTRKNPAGAQPNPGQNGSVALMSYDPVTNAVYEDEANTNEFWKYDLASNSWTDLGFLGNASAPLTPRSAIDPVRRQYYVIGAGAFWKASLTSPYTSVKLSGTGCSPIVSISAPGFEFDPTQNKFVGWAGGSTVYIYDPATDSCTSQTFSGGPGAAQANATYGRFRYFPSLGVFALVNDASQNAYTLRLSSGATPPPPLDTTPPSVPTGLTASAVSSSQVNLSWTASTDNVGVTGYKIFRGGSQIATTAGTSYSDTGLAASTAYSYAVSAYDAAGNNSAQSASVSATTLSSGGGVTANQDFSNRCSAPGVILCQGFDTPSVLAPAAWPASGIYPDDTNTFNNTTIDTTVSVSGGGSLKFTIPSKADGNTGYWRQLFNSNPAAGPSAAQVFGQNSTFYVQFQQRFSPEFLTNVWPAVGGGTTYWKQEIFSNDQSTCGNEELTTINAYMDGFPQMYSQCGQDPFQPAVGTGDFLLEQGDTPTTGYNCHYLNKNPTDCFYYPSNTWITFYYQVSIGNWGQANSTIKAWVALPGQPYKEWINMPNHTLFQDTGEPGYDMVTLLPYMTARDPNVSAGPTAYTWYDELIVSRQPIAAPGGTPPPSDTTPPTVAITSPANSATVSGTISITGTAADNVTVSKVQVSIDGGAYASASGTTNWTFSLNTTALSNASHTISAKATDTSGNVSTVASITVTVNNTAPPPSAPVITSALTALGAAGSAFSYQITASNSPASFNATGLPAGLTVNTGTGLISGTPNAAGTSNVTISATNAGGTGSATLALTINNPPDTVPPTVSITSPANGATLSGTVAISVAASDNVGVTRVELYLGSTLVASDTATSYGFSWNTKQVANNTYTLTAKAYDAAGNVGTSSGITVTVRNRRIMVQLVASPSLSFTVTSLLAGISSNSNQANFSIEVDTAGEPSFPVAPFLQVTVSMPSGSKSLSLSQLSTNPLVYYAKLSKGQFGSQDFTQLTGMVVTITVGTMTFMADGHNDQVQPALGGTIQDPNGIAAVVVQPGQVSQTTQVNITPASNTSSLTSGLTKLNSKAVGSPINIQIISSGTVTATTIVIPFDPTLISSGLTANQVGLAYQDPVSGNWVLGSNVSLIGNAAAMTVNSGTTFVAALLMPSSIPGLKNAYVFPNPAVKADPTIRAFLGVVSSVEVTIFDVSGHVVNSGSVSGAPTGIINGQYYYDYKWTGRKASGGYAAVVHGKAADGTIVRARVRFVVVN